MDRASGWIVAALVLSLAGCAPVAPSPPGRTSTTSAPVTTVADAPAPERDAQWDVTQQDITQRDSRERLWAAISLRPEVVPGGPAFVGGGAETDRLLSSIGCQFIVLNGDAVDRQFNDMRVTIAVTTRIHDYPVTNTFYLNTGAFRVPAGGSMLVGSAQLPSDGAGLFAYQFGGGWENESWGRVYRGPLANQDAFVSLDVPSVNLHMSDPALGPSDKTFPITGCQISGQGEAGSGS